MEEIDIKQELESDAVPAPGSSLGENLGDPKHQFNDDGMRYESKHHLIMWLVVFAVAAGAIGYFFVGTQTGRDLLTQARNNSFFSTSTSSFSLSSLSPSSQESSSPSILPRDFSGLSAEEISTQLQADLGIASDISDPEKLFEDLDSEAELGVVAKTSSSTSSSGSSKSGSSSSRSSSSTSSR